MLRLVRLKTKVVLFHNVRVDKKKGKWDLWPAQYWTQVRCGMCLHVVHLLACYEGLDNRFFVWFESLDIWIVMQLVAEQVVFFFNIAEQVFDTKRVDIICSPIP